MITKNLYIYEKEKNMTFIELFKKQNRREQITRSLMYLMGTCLLPVGIVLTINSHFGAGGMDALNFVVGERLHIPVSISIYVIGLVAIFIAAILRRRRPKFEVFLTSLIQGGFTGIWKVVLADVQAETVWSGLLLFLLGNLIIAFFAAPYFLSELPTNPIDDLTVAITEKRVRFSVAKIGIEAGCAVLAFILHGEINIGTIIVILGLGPMIDFFQTRWSKWMKKYGQLPNEVPVCQSKSRTNI